MMGVNFVTVVGVVYPPLPCRASPPQGGRLARRTCVAPSRPKKNAGPCRESISPLEGEMPGRAEGGVSCSERSVSHTNVAVRCSEPTTPC